MHRAIATKYIGEKDKLQTREDKGHSRRVETWGEESSYKTGLAPLCSCLEVQVAILGVRAKTQPLYRHTSPLNHSCKTTVFECRLLLLDYLWPVLPFPVLTKFVTMTQYEMLIVVQVN